VANHEAHFDAVFAGLTSFSGWSVKKARTTYISTSFILAIYAVAEHTSGAELALVWAGWTNSSITHSSNMRKSAGTGGNSDYKFYVGYIPPGAASEFSNALLPNASGWLTDPSIVFALHSASSNSNNNTLGQLNAPFNAGGQTAFTWQNRGDDVMLVIEINSHQDTGVDCLNFWGTGFDGLYHDPNDTDQEVAIGFLDDGVSNDISGGTGGRPDLLDFFSAAGTLIVDCHVRDPGVVIGSATGNPGGAPYNVAQLECYETASVATVYSNDAIKGLISNEVMFLTPEGVPPKTTWNGGVMVHLRAGVWVGSDASNPAWP
jgi:hypothetical protein